VVLEDVLLSNVNVGEKYGKLTIIEKTENGWLTCLCDCGNIKKFRKSNLIKKTHPTKSCGCLLSDILHKRNSSKKGILTTPYGHSAITCIIKNYKQGAKKRGYKFELKREEVEYLVNKPCIYCGELHSSVIKTKCYDYPYNGIDRVDNTENYTIDNCVACCSFCNRAKYIYDKEYFINKCKKIAENNT